MTTTTRINLDIDTVLLLREVLEDTWASLRPEQRATMSKTLLAEGILKAAASGERDPKTLADAALSCLRLEIAS